MTGSRRTKQTSSTREERQAERDRRQAERRRARQRERSQIAPVSLLRLRRPAERPGHQASTAHVQAAYPAVTEAGLGSRGVLIGRDAYGGSFVFDPWVLYGAGMLTNANTMVFGHVGFGKSSLTKCMLLRQRVFGRVVEIIDPKGEYLPLVRAMGGVVLRLEPGGSIRLNPLTRVGTPRDARRPARGRHAGDARAAADAGRSTRPRGDAAGRRRRPRRERRDVHPARHRAAARPDGAGRRSARRQGRAGARRAA